MRISITLKGEYDEVMEKILEHRPHLKTKTGAIERALDYYLDSIVRLDVRKKELLNWIGVGDKEK